FQERPMQKNLYCVHGITVRFITNSPVIASAAAVLLRHFQHEVGDGLAHLELSLHAVASRAEVPVRVSSSAQTVSSSRGVAAGDRLRTEWRCTIYRDEGRKVADFHEQGLLAMDDRQGRVEGYLVAPEAIHSDVRISFIQFALTEMLKGRGMYTIHATA